MVDEPFAPRVDRLETECQALRSELQDLKTRVDILQEQLRATEDPLDTQP